jgi:hypothetical protein
LIFAFDEIVALGYRENVNLAQIRTFTDMDSHEERVYKAMRETQEKEAKQRMLEKAEEIRKSKLAAEKGLKSSSHYSGGFGSSHSSSSSSSFNTNPSAYTEPSSFEPLNSYSSSTGSSSSTMNLNKPSRAMKLGTNKDNLPAFIEQQVKQTLAPIVQQSTSSSNNSSSVPVNFEK